MCGNVCFAAMMSEIVPLRCNPRGRRRLSLLLDDGGAHPGLRSCALAAGGGRAERQDGHDLRLLALWHVPASTISARSAEELAEALVAPSLGLHEPIGFAYTGRPTGKPKGLRTPTFIALRSDCAACRMGLAEDVRILICAPAQPCRLLRFSFLPCSGLVIVMPGFDALATLEAIENSHHLYPTWCRRDYALRDHPLLRSSISEPRIIGCASAMAPSRLSELTR